MATGLPQPPIGLPNNNVPDTEVPLLKAILAAVIAGGGGGGSGITIVTTDPSGSGTANAFQFNSVNGKIWGVVSGTWTLLFVCALTVTNTGANFMCPDGNIRTATLST